MSETVNRAGKRLGERYMLLSLIARGGMGEVWKARDTFTGQLVAAKVLRSELNGEEVSLSRLRLEAHNAMRAKHPNIAAVLDSGEESGQGWLIMELVEGEPLNEYMGDGLKLTAAQLIPILIQTAYALDAAARADVVHRDIKPANILVKPDGRVKLTDFGVSRAEGQANLTAVGMVMGTVQYLPPEQATGGPATPVGDLYALGIVAFEALTGARPYTGKTKLDIASTHVNAPIPALPDYVPEDLGQVVTALLAKKPEDRPQTGSALARELMEVAARLGTGTEPVPLRSGLGTPSPEAPVAETSPAPTLVADEVGQPDVPAPRRTEAAPPRRPSQRAQGKSQWRPVSPAARPVAPPPRAAASLPDPDPGPPLEPPKVKGRPDWGLWIIVGLVVLTVILIIVAMVRNHAREADMAFPAVSESEEVQEVQTWLTPAPVV